MTDGDDATKINYKDNVELINNFGGTGRIPDENDYHYNSNNNRQQTIELQSNRKEENNKNSNENLVQNTEKSKLKEEINGEKNEVEKRIENEVSKVKKDLDFQLELTWTEINMFATVTEGKCCSKKESEKQILSNCSGSLSTGSSLAILGASGAGKTTLLNFLSRKIQNKALKTTGKVTLNNNELSYEDFSAITSYVMQDDMLEPSMTPKEILLFTAKMKLKGTLKEIEERVQYLLKILRIEGCQNTQIGDNIQRGVSGGERKRTSIAVELLADSPIIFLDEPTTGLDSFNAYEVVNTLNGLCLQDKMVIFTIHQPASEIFGLLSKICILALGKTVYFGPTDNIYKFFEDVRLPIKLNYNPFEHFIEVTNISIVEESYVIEAYPELTEIESNKEKYRTLVSRLNEKYEASYKYVPENKYAELSQNMLKVVEAKKITHSFPFQLYLLSLRYMIISFRNKKVLFAKIFQFAFMGFILAIVYNGMRTDETGSQDRRGLLIMGSIMSVMMSTTSAILVFAEDRWVFLRERSNYLYSPFSYYIAKYLASIPVNFISVCLFSVLAYYSCDLNAIYAYKFYVYIGIMLLMTNAATFYSYFLASFVTDATALATANVLFSIPLLMLSGFFSSDKNFVEYLIPFKYLSLFKYGYQLFIENEFKDGIPFLCSNPPDSCNLLNDLKFNESMATSFALSGAVGIFFSILGYIILYYYVRIKL